MGTEEIVRALRAAAAKWEAKNKFIGTGELRVHDALNDAADLIESLQAQLADYHHMSELVDGKRKENQRLRRINENLQEQLSASQCREKAAVEFIKYLDRNYSGYMAEDERFADWRGPQEAGKGEQE